MRSNRDVKAAMSNLALGLLLAALVLSCSLVAPSEDYELSKVNGQPLPAVYLRGNVTDGSILEGIMVRGRMRFFPPNRFEIEFRHRSHHIEGTDTTRVRSFPFWRWGRYMWTDTTLELNFGPDEGWFGRWRIIGDRRTLRGDETLPTGMTLEWKRN